MLGFDVGHAALVDVAHVRFGALPFEVQFLEPPFFQNGDSAFLAGGHVDDHLPFDVRARVFGLVLIVHVRYEPRRGMGHRGMLGERRRARRDVGSVARCRLGGLRPAPRTAAAPTAARLARTFCRRLAWRRGTCHRWFRHGRRSVGAVVVPGERALRRPGAIRPAATPAPTTPTPAACRTRHRCSRSRIDRVKLDRTFDGRLGDLRGHLRPRFNVGLRERRCSRFDECGLRGQSQGSHRLLGALRGRGKLLRRRGLGDGGAVGGPVLAPAAARARAPSPGVGRRPRFAGVAFRSAVRGFVGLRRVNDRRGLCVAGRFERLRLSVGGVTVLRRRAAASRAPFAGGGRGGGFVFATGSAFGSRRRLSRFYFHSTFTRRVFARIASSFTPKAAQTSAGLAVPAPVTSRVIASPASVTVSDTK